MILLTGGTGFVGGRLLRRLLADGRKVRTTVRSDRDGRRLENLGAETVKADVMDEGSMAAAMEGVDVAINLVGIIREYPRKGITFENLHHIAVKNFAAAAGSADVRKVIHMSALGTRPGAASAYHRTKHLGEQEVVNSGLAYTIFRPSTQIGEEGEFVEMMMDLISKAPVMPVFGSGTYRMQPMDVDDTAAFFAAAIDDLKSDNRIYELGGPEQMTYVQLLDAFMDALGKRKPKIFIPGPVADLMVASMQVLPEPPITRTQYRMLKEDNVCDNGPALADFDIELSPIEPVLKRAAVKQAS